jgi:hypothetical protein
MLLMKPWPLAIRSADADQLSSPKSKRFLPTIIRRRRRG